MSVRKCLSMAFGALKHTSHPIYQVLAGFFLQEGSVVCSVV